MIHHVILNGLYDDKIRRDVFGQPNLETMKIEYLFMLIEAKETARETTSSPATSAVSQFKKSQKEVSSQATFKQTLEQKGKCNSCGVEFLVYKKMEVILYL